MKFKPQIARNIASFKSLRLSASLRLVKTLLAFTVIIFLSGCLSVKPATVKSSKHLFETFYVGEEGMQYYLKPLTFVNPQNKEEAQVDFTFRYKDEIKDSALIHLSLLSSLVVKSIDSLSFSNATHKIALNSVKLMFNERSQVFFKSRFTANISLNDLNEMFTTEDWSLLVYSNGVTTTYVSTRRTNKSIKKLRDNIFVLLQ